jgi:hypothetical protein
MEGLNFNANPMEDNNLTTIYTMGEEKLVIIGELNQTVSDEGQIQTFIENIFVKFNTSTWTRVTSRGPKACHPISPQMRSIASAEDKSLWAEQYYSWNYEQEALLVTITCKDYGLDVHLEKLDQETDGLSPLEWEREQPGYGGMCLTCNYEAYEGEVPHPSMIHVQSMGTEVDNALRFTDKEDFENSVATNFVSTVFVIFVVAAANLF